MTCSCAWCRAACALQCDLEAATIDREKLDAFCREHGFIGWFETSAKKNHNIEASVRFLVRNILSHPDAFEAQRKAQEVRVCVCVCVCDSGCGGRVCLCECGAWTCHFICAGVGVLF